jgi:hypothetical protein
MSLSRNFHLSGDLNIAGDGLSVKTSLGCKSSRYGLWVKRDLYSEYKGPVKFSIRCRVLSLGFHH